MVLSELPRLSDYKVKTSRSGKVTVYHSNLGGNLKDRDNDYDRANNVTEKGCILTPRSVDRVKAGAQFIFSQQNLRFITVTLPGSVDTSPDLDTTYTACLGDLLRYMKRLGMTNYIWVAERQDGKRKNDGSEPRWAIHYHIFCNIPFVRGLGPSLSEKWCSLIGGSVALNCVDVDVVPARASVDAYMTKTGVSRIARFVSSYLSKRRSGSVSAEDKEKLRKHLIFSACWGSDRQTSQESLPVVAWATSCLTDFQIEEVKLPAGDGVEIIFYVSTLPQYSLYEELTSLAPLSELDFCKN